MLKKFLHRIARWLFRYLTHTQIYGLENLPSEGAYILATNHLSRFDPPLIFALIDREDVTALVAKKYLRYPFFRILVNAVDGIWLDRENPDPKALRAAWTHLREGGIIGIAPEGTRSSSHALLPAKSGVAFLATKAGVSIVPVGITGTENIISDGYHLRRSHITVRIGKPFYLPRLNRKDKDSSLRRNTDEIMCRIAFLLPPRYRGVYSDHSRLKALLSEVEDSDDRPR
ncbi:MAG: lysophospholipid acyltransferase family protein [Chloroflexota bacterium]